MLGFLVTVFLIWVAYKFIKAYVNAKSQIRSKEYGKEARHLAVNEFGVPLEFYNYIVQNSMDVLKESALDMRESIVDYKDVSWPRMLAWTTYLAFLNLCKAYIANDSSSKAMIKAFGISHNKIIEVVSCEILDPFKKEVLYTNIFQENTNNWENELWEWQETWDRHYFGKKISDFKITKSIDILNDHKFVELPEAIGCLINLEEIEISYCYEFSRLPSTLSDLKALHTIKLFESGGKNSVLLDNISKVPNLKKLDISGTPVGSNIPSNFQNLQSLEELSFERLSGLECLGESIGKLKSLRKLSLISLSKLTSLPNNLGDLDNLEELYIAHNENLTIIPDSIIKLKKLKHLHITGIPKAILPSTFFDNFADLISLEIELNNQYNRDVLQRSFSKLNQLETLVIRECIDHEYIDSLIRSLPNLKNLTLIECGLKAIPNIQNNLTEVSIFRATIEFEIKSLHNCHKLKSLTLVNDHNLLGIFEHLWEFDSLEKLKISHMNNLKNLPDNLKNLNKIKYLSLTYLEDLQELPDYISDFKNLKELDVSGCEKLQNLPEELALLPKLELIQKGYINIDIPDSLLNKEDLKIIDYKI